MTINVAIAARASTEFGDLGVDRRIILKWISNMSCTILNACEVSSESDASGNGRLFKSNSFLWSQ